MQSILEMSVRFQCSSTFCARDGEALMSPTPPSGRKAIIRIRNSARSQSVIRMRTPLQEQLLKAGLVKKHKVAAAVREQNQQRQGKAAAPDDAERVDTQQILKARAERDRALAAERNAELRARELRAQVRQIVETHKVPRAGEIAYRFVDGVSIRNILVNELQRNQLAKGTLVIVPHDQGYELLPRTAAEMVYERQGPVVLDHGRAVVSEVQKSTDAYYDRFVVPDDLIW